MKIKVEDELLIIYLYNKKMNLDILDEVTKSIKELLVKIIRYHNFPLSGIYEVIIYENNNYGYVLEIKQIKEFEYSDFIDLKLIIKKNQPFYLVVNNYNYVDDCRNVYYKNNLFFVNVEDVSNVNSKIELGEIFYKNINVLLDCSVKIK